MRFIHTLKGEGTPMLSEEILLVHDGECCSGQVQPDTFLKEFSNSIGD